jgi:AraC-like DNA-binding protein
MNIQILRTKTLSASYGKDEKIPFVGSSSHFHNNYELFFALSDGVEYIVGDAVYMLKKYDALFIPPTIFHYPRQKEEREYERFIINFHGGDISKKLKPFLSEAKTHYAFQNNSVIKNAYRELITLREHATEEDIELAVKQYLHLILLQMKYASPEQDTAQPLHATLSAILQYIDGHLHEELDAETLSSVFFVSSSWIYYAFKKHLGVSLSSYVNNKKVLLAQRLIQSGTPPTKVFSSCGFQDYSTFYRQYKRHFNAPPKVDK